MALILSGLPLLFYIIVIKNLTHVIVILPCFILFDQSNGRPIGSSTRTLLRDRIRSVKIRERNGSIASVITRRYANRKECEKRVSVSPLMKSAEDEFHISRGAIKKAGFIKDIRE